MTMYVSWSIGLLNCKELQAISYYVVVRIDIYQALSSVVQEYWKKRQEEEPFRTRGIRNFWTLNKKTRKCLNCFKYTENFFKTFHSLIFLERRSQSYGRSSSFRVFWLASYRFSSILILNDARDWLKLCLHRFEGQLDNKERIWLYHRFKK